jgi:hypothetical protein
MAGIRFVELRASIVDDYGHRLQIDWDGKRLVLAVYPGDDIVTVPVVALGREQAEGLTDLLTNILAGEIGD